MTAAAPDPAALAALHARAFVVPRPWHASEVAALLAAPDVRCASVGAAGDLAGFGMIRVVADEAELLTLAVDPNLRRQGHGAALLGDLIRRAAAAGAAQMFLEVAEDNHAARRLYANAGFVEAGRRRGYYRMPAARATDALLLRRAPLLPAAGQ